MSIASEEYRDMDAITSTFRVLYLTCAPSTLAAVQKESSLSFFQQHKQPDA